MTNTLHRFGTAESFRDDIVIFARTSRGKNDKDWVPKLKRFLEMALKYNPVNLGDSAHGGALRPKELTPSAHWCRDMELEYRTVIDGIDTRPTPWWFSTTCKRPRRSASRRSRKPTSASASTCQPLWRMPWHAPAPPASLGYQPLVLAWLRGPDRKAAEHPGADAVDHDVRSRHG